LNITRLSEEVYSDVGFVVRLGAIGDDVTNRCWTIQLM